MSDFDGGGHGMIRVRDLIMDTCHGGPTPVLVHDFFVSKVDDGTVDEVGLWCIRVTTDDGLFRWMNIYRIARRSNGVLFIAANLSESAISVVNLSAWPPK